ITPDHLGLMYGTNASEAQTKLTGRVHKVFRDEASPPAADSARVSDHLWEAVPRQVGVGSLSLEQRAIETLRTARLKQEAAGAVATVDLGAMRRNFRAGLEKLGEGVTAAAVIKADGYGLGAMRVAKVLLEEGCRDFFVARISEAVDLRKSLRTECPELADKVAINVLDGNLAGSDPQWLIEHRITPVLNSLEQVQEWNEAGRAQARPLPAILQVDSGMNRAGMHEADLQALLAGRGQYLDHVKLQFIMTHLANAGEAAPGPDGTLQPGEATRRQQARFEEICAHFPGVKASIGASSTVFLGKDLHKDMVRVGGTFHGQAPFDADSNPLEQVMTLHSRIAQVRELQPSDGIGYGFKYVADKPMSVATIPIGYADGLPRVGGGNRAGDGPTRAHVLVDGRHKAPLVGATSMDMTTVDVSAVPREALRPGTPVTVVGDGITPDHLGLMYGTNASEAQTKLTGRVHKVFRDEASPPAADSRRASEHLWSALKP
ncbi:MAG TPA: alanine racemase, partial [Burkholderiaceae bacterium]|nr:alanine racemase [Burkholderiaceae bacterium]